MSGIRERTASRETQQTFFSLYPMEALGGKGTLPEGPLENVAANKVVRA